MGWKDFSHCESACEGKTRLSGRQRSQELLAMKRQSVHVPPMVQGWDDVKRLQDLPDVPVTGREPNSPDEYLLDRVDRDDGKIFPNPSFIIELHRIVADCDDQISRL